MLRKENYKHDESGFNPNLRPSDVVTVKPFVNSPVPNQLTDLAKWRASDHRIVVDLPADMPNEIDSQAVAEIISNNTWFLRSAIPTILNKEQSYNEAKGTANLKLAGYGITGLTPGSVDLSKWQPGLKKPLLYRSTIGNQLNEYLHLFTVPASGKSNNSMTAKANHVAMNKVDKWVDGEPFSPTVSVIATYVIAAGLKALSENTQLDIREIERSILKSENAVQFQGAIATVVLHGLSRWHVPMEWASKMNSVQVKAGSANAAQRGLRITNHSLTEGAASYVNAILKDLPNALSFQLQKALRAIEWDGSTRNDGANLLSK